jgi:hypothetical protein
MELPLIRVQLVQLVREEIRAQLVRQDLLDLKVYKALSLDLLDLKVYKALSLDQPANKAQPVHKVQLRVQLENKVQ